MPGDSNTERTELERLRAENKALRAALEDPRRALEILKRALERESMGPRVETSPASAPTVVAGRRARALRARCSVRKLGDDARRKALEQAYREGALEPGFDETQLPWHDPSYALDPKVNPVTAESISLAAGALFDLSDTEYNFWLMARVARLGRAWEAWGHSIERAWIQLRDRPGDPDAPFRSMTGASADPHHARYPDYTVAVQAQDLSYPGGSPLRQRGKWFSPQSGWRRAEPIFEEGTQELARSPLARAALSKSRRATNTALARLAMEPVRTQALALLEIALGTDS